MDEISISSLVGELHQPLNNALKDPLYNTIAVHYHLIFAREREGERVGGREKYRTEKKKEGEGGGTVQRMIRLRLYVKFVRLLSEIQRL